MLAAYIRVSSSRLPKGAVVLARCSSVKPSQQRGFAAVAAVASGRHVVERSGSIGQAICAAALQPLEELISRGLSKRLLALGATSGTAPVVAVAGAHSIEFAAALRAVRAAGAVAAPVDVQGRSGEDLGDYFAEAQARLTIAAGISAPKEVDALKLAMRRLGTDAVTVVGLCKQGQDEAPLSPSSAPPPMLLLSRCATSSASAEGHPGLFRAAEVPVNAFDARVRSAIKLWGLTKRDCVLSLGLRSDATSALVDALEAPLAVGARVHLPRVRADISSAPHIWDLWTAVREESEATIIIIDASVCWRLLDAHAQLAKPIQTELANRWAQRPLRHTIAVARPGMVLSRELSKQWTEVFNSPLTWLYSCAEAGSLFTAKTAAALEIPAASVPEAFGLDWKIGDEDELLVRGAGLFTCYRGRPRSTAEVLVNPDSDDMLNEEASGTVSFCRTGHRASFGATSPGTLEPAPLIHDDAAVRDTDRFIRKGPGPRPHMAGYWKVKKVEMRVYYYWKGKKGYRIYTKKHNNVKVVYTSKRERKHRS